MLVIVVRSGRCFFVQVKNKPMCLICNKEQSIFSDLKKIT